MKNVLILLIFIFIFLVGGEFAKRNIFPYGFGLREFYISNNFFFKDFLKVKKIDKIKIDKIKIDKQKKNIKNKKDNKEKEVKEKKICRNPEINRNLHRRFNLFSNKKKDNIFIGDSIVLGANSPNLFNLNYDLIGVDGAIVECAQFMVKYINKIQPNNLIIYLGGNDADGASKSNVDKVSQLYKEFVEDLKKIESISKIYIIGINFALSPTRDMKYVTDLNKSLKEISDGKKIIYINSFEVLNFNKKRIEVIKKLSQDGEHLNYEGYRIWFNYLNNHIPNLSKN